jgi:hypothetical protein
VGGTPTETETLPARRNHREGNAALALGLGALAFAVVPLLAALCVIAGVVSTGLGARVYLRARGEYCRVGIGLARVSVLIGCAGTGFAAMTLFSLGGPFV